MTEATESVQKRTTANKSAGPITAGLGGLILGAGIFSIGTAAPAAAIIGVIAFLVGLVLLLDGVYKLVGNIDSATQALLERRP